MLAAHLDVALGPFRLDVALSARPGETLAVVGPNAAGKTTTLRALAGLVPLRAGRVELDGTVLEEPGAGIRLPPDRRPVAVVFQDLLLFPHLSVLENVAFGPRARGAPAAVARGRAREWLDRLAIADLAGVRPGELSGGQAQRVALARALATSPGLLLLDEPLTALDVGARRQLRRELRHVLTDATGVRLVVTHDPFEAAVLADRLAVLEAGRIVQVGRPEEVATRPRSVFAAQFSGLNLLRGTARGTEVILPGGAAVVTAEAERGDVFVAVRPESVALHRDRPEGSPRNVWPGTVDHLEAADAAVRVHVAGPVALVAAVTRTAAEELGLAPGAPVWVAVKATEIDVYPV